MFRFGAMLRDKGKAALNEGDVPGPVRSNSRGLIERALPPISRPALRRNLHPTCLRASTQTCARPSRACGPAPGRPSSGPCPNGISPTSTRPWTARISRSDLARAEAECKAFAETYRGTLDGLARGARTPRDALGAAVLRYEAIEDLLGRIMSYAGLVYSGDTTDPKRAKFYGDTQERLTAASSELLFFTLELNRIDDAVLDAAMAGGAACPLPALARGHPQGQALPARGQDRAAVPREVGHRARGLEPPFRRDHRVAALRRCAARN